MTYLYLIIFAFGITFGSFLNCAIHRLKTGENLRGSSYCPACRHKLSPLDLVPLFSFFFLKGGCRYCDKKISFQYPAVELITGLLFLSVFISQPLEANLFTLGSLVSVLTITLFLVILFVYDLKHYIIPNRVIYPAIVFAFLFQIFENNLSITPDLGLALLSGLFSFLFFLGIYLATKGKGLGFGDVRYAAFMGLFLGFPEVLVGLFSSFLLGAFIGLVLIVSGLKSRKDMIPFGPFLVIGTFFAFFFGELIIDFYLNLLI